MPRSEPAGAPAHDRAFQPKTPLKGSFLTKLVGGDVWSGVAYGAAPDSGWIRSKTATPKRQQAVNYRWLKPNMSSFQVSRNDHQAQQKLTCACTTRSLWLLPGIQRHLAPPPNKPPTPVPHFHRKQLSSRRLRGATLHCPLDRAVRPDLEVPDRLLAQAAPSTRQVQQVLFRQELLLDPAVLVDPNRRQAGGPAAQHLKEQSSSVSSLYCETIIGRI